MIQLFKPFNRQISYYSGIDFRTTFLLEFCFNIN